MDSLDQQVFDQVAQWLEAGESCWLCTVVATFGAAPRPIGSLLACTRESFAGSLSGGCVEDDLLEKLRSGELRIEQPQVLEYGVTPEQNERLGLPCGGRLHVLVERWNPSPELLEKLRELQVLLQRRRIVERRLDMRSGDWQIREENTFSALQLSTELMQQCYGPRYQMLLIGAGEVARCLATMALMFDYRVLVCDPRPEMIARFDVDGVERLRCMPDDAVREHCCNDRRSIVITLAHDPRIDDMALMEALQHELFYVGALGSERTSAARRQRLLQLDVTEQQLARLHAPVGLPIGSKRPPEIAVAILAELTRLRSAQADAG
jgi:xanthine dehydrogenase accessory factor